jgi:hypothetical protein
MRERLFLAAAGVLGSAAVLFARDANAADGESANTFTSLLVNVVPWIVVFVFIWFFVFKALRRAQPHQERLIQHMEKIEQQYDRIIQLLEKLVDRQPRD